jgi:pyruvate kinase
MRFILMRIRSSPPLHPLHLSVWQPVIHSLIPSLPQSLIPMCRNTKIICTIGPASAGVEQLTRLITAGMDVARLNFSHGTREEHLATIRDIRKASERTGKHVAILQDLQGPKIRVGMVEGGAVELMDGAACVIVAGDASVGTAARFGTPYALLAREVQAGGTLLLDDGYIILVIEKTTGNEIHCTVRKGGTLRNHKGIIAPGARISAPAVSEKDIEDMRFGLAEGVDAVALSFVSSERDIIELRATMRLFGRVVPIIAKLERYEGVVDIEDIVREADGIMVARGDLGLEMPAEDVPVLQKRMIDRCNYYGKPVITATQMLESMIANPRPTRAEASDVANAVIDGTDCVMLSGETSVGRFPVEAVETMDRIIRTTERHFHHDAPLHEVPADVRHNTADAIGRACCVIAGQIHAAAIVPLTSSGGTARIIAKYRPTTPILALTDNEDTLRQLAFVWGIIAARIPSIAESDDIFAVARDAVRASGIASAGTQVVFTAGMPFSQRVSTNMLKVEQL